MRCARLAVLWLSLAILGLPLTAPAAMAQTCGPYAEWVRYLLDTWQETPKATGVNHQSIPFTLFANESTGSWTLIVGVPEVSCIVAHGTNFNLVKGTPL